MTGATLVDPATVPLDDGAMPTKTKPPRLNQIGQKIGAKGERTRQRLIDITVGLLETRGMRDLTVAEIARVAETSPATFYVYFDSVQAVVLGALERAPHSNDELVALIERPWDRGVADALAFVTLYTDLWNRHGTIFRVRNMAAEEGDERFLAARGGASVPMLKAIWQSLDLPRSVAMMQSLKYCQIGNPVGVPQVDRTALMADKAKKFTVR